MYVCCYTKKKCMTKACQICVSALNIIICNYCFYSNLCFEGHNESVTASDISDRSIIIRQVNGIYLNDHSFIVSFERWLEYGSDIYHTMMYSRSEIITRYSYNIFLFRNKCYAIDKNV